MIKPWFWHFSFGFILDFEFCHLSLNYYIFVPQLSQELSACQHKLFIIRETLR